MSDSSFIPDDKLPKYKPDTLKTIRKRELGLSQEKLAEKAGCDTKTVQRYESGESRIPLDFIRLVERLRVEEREKRAREAGANEIDYTGFQSIPGLELVELVPVRKILGSLFRWFIAVPKEMLPPAAGESGPTSPATGGGGDAGQQQTREGRAEFRMIMGGHAGLALLSLVLLGAVLLLRNEIRDFRSALRFGRARVARGAKVERPVSPPVLSQSQGGAEVTEEQEPDGVPGEVYSDGVPDGTGENGVESKHSIPLPKKPYKWQKVAPCDKEHGETEEGGGCYQITPNAHPPCPRYTVENASQQCLMPVPAEPKPAKPSSVEPVK